MSTPPPLDAERLIGGLARDGVAFVLIGGFAVVAHGVVRATKDVDVVLEPETRNYQRLSACLTTGSLAGSSFVWETGMLDLDLGDDVDLARGAVHRIATPFGWLDVVNRPAGAPPYDELAAGAVVATIDGERVRIVSVPHLAAMKLAADRPRDRLDLGELRAIADLPDEEAGGR